MQRGKCEWSKYIFTNNCSVHSDSARHIRARRPTLARNLIVLLGSRVVSRRWGADTTSASAATNHVLNGSLKSYKQYCCCCCFFTWGDFNLSLLHVLHAVATAFVCCSYVVRKLLTLSTFVSVKQLFVACGIHFNVAVSHRVCCAL